MKKSTAVYASLLAMFIVVSLGLVACSQQGAAPAARTPKPLDANTRNSLMTAAGLSLEQTTVPAIELRLPNLAGSSVALSSLKGKVVLLNFWATWCPPCRAEMPGLEALFQAYQNQPDFVLLAVDAGETTAVAQQFMQNNNYHFGSLVDEAGVASNSYGIDAIPSSYLIDRHGSIVATMVGSHDWNTPPVKAAIDALLAE